MSKKNDTKRVNKDVMIRVRVTLDERERFMVRAKEQGYATVSEFIRSLVTEKNADSPEDVLE